MITFPISAADFYTQLKIRSVVFEVSENTVSSTTGAGELIRAKLGPTLWQGSFSGVPSFHNEADLEALADLLRRPNSSFMVFDNRFNGPRRDPGGVILGASLPNINSVEATNRRLSIRGLPASYVLSRGDYIGFQYGAGLSALHRIVAVSATANGAGITPLFEITPVLRPGVPANAPISLVRPVCKAMMIPGSLQTGRAELVHTQGISMGWRQTLR